MQIWNQKSENFTQKQKLIGSKNWRPKNIRERLHAHARKNFRTGNIKVSFYQQTTSNYIHKNLGSNCDYFLNSAFIVNVKRE